MWVTFTGIRDTLNQATWCQKYKMYMLSKYFAGKDGVAYAFMCIQLHPDIVGPLIFFLDYPNASARSYDNYSP